MATSPKKSTVRTSTPVEADLEVAVPNVEEAVASLVEPTSELTQSVRTALGDGVTKSRATFARAKASADEAANAFELSFAAARDGLIAINAKGLEALRANTEANLDFIKAIFAVKTLSELVALQSEFARKQAQAVSVQVKDLSALGRKTVTETIEPVKEQVAKSFKMVV